MNLVGIFQDFKRIYGFCPRCHERFRLSEAALFTRQAPPRTDFDNLDMEWKKVEDKQRRLEAQRRGRAGAVEHAARGQHRARRPPLPPPAGRRGPDGDVRNQGTERGDRVVERRDIARHDGLRSGDDVRGNDNRIDHQEFFPHEAFDKRLGIVVIRKLPRRSLQPEGFAVGFWQDLDEVRSKAVIEREFRPSLETTERNFRYAGWKKAVARAQAWEEQE